jgi:hypothetical protein
MENFSQATMFVNLAPEPKMCDELETINGTLCDMGDCDVVVDFSSADIVTASSLSKLLKLRQMLVDSGRRLLLIGSLNSLLTSLRFCRVTNLLYRHSRYHSFTQAPILVPRRFVRHIYVFKVIIIANLTVVKSIGRYYNRGGSGKV